MKYLYEYEIKERRSLHILQTHNPVERVKARVSFA